MLLVDALSGVTRPLYSCRGELPFSSVAEEMDSSRLVRCLRHVSRRRLMTPPEVDP